MLEECEKLSGGQQLQQQFKLKKTNSYKLRLAARQCQTTKLLDHRGSLRINLLEVTSHAQSANSGRSGELQGAGNHLISVL